MGQGLLQKIGPQGEHEAGRWPLDCLSRSQQDIEKLPALLDIAAEGVELLKLIGDDKQASIGIALLDILEIIG